MALTDILFKNDEKPESDDGEAEDLSSEEQLEDAKKSKPTLLTIKPSKLAKFVKDRWHAQDSTWRRRLVQLRVNYLRYQGDTFAQAHPRDPNRLLPTPTGKRTPPAMNRIRRAVHRYVAQVTADEPVMEAMPASSRDDDRDAAEAATKVLSGEWNRMRLQNSLRRVVHIASILRSGFWLFEWDPRAGGKVPAQIYVENPETKEDELVYVDENGEPVESEDDAEQVWQGNIRCEVLTPGNVRWWGANYAHDAEEVLVSTLVTLRQVYDMAPHLRKVPIKDLVGTSTKESETWMEDIRGASPRLTIGESDIDDQTGLTGEALEMTDSALDQRVMLIRYYHKRTEQYPEGVYAMVAGKRLVRRGPLPYKCINIAHFKCLDELIDQLGLSIVDILRDPQELLDFINSQILRYLQMLKRRWFVPTTSMVKARDLLNPTKAVIEFNAAGGQPIPEQQPEIPNSLVKWADRFDGQFDDQLGIHDTMAGKHVPGVSSGRHAEALRTGDETILGLTRTQIEEGLLAAGKVILEMTQEEWEMPRRVRYMGEDRDYVEEAFSNADFRSTEEVRLKRGTLLMLTPAQKLETLYASAQLGMLDAADLRRLVPLADTAGVSVTEEPHYKRARRQNRRFLKGPPDELIEAHEGFERQVEQVESQQGILERMTGGQPSEDAQIALQALVSQLEAAESEYESVRSKYAFVSEPWEMDPRIASIHAVEHPRALSSERAEAMPDFWVEMFTEHVQQDQIAAGVVPDPNAPGPEGAGGMGQEPGGEGMPVRSGASAPSASPQGFSTQGFPTASPVGEG